MTMRTWALTLIAMTASLATAAAGRATWCLGIGALGPMRTGMSAEQVLGLADWPGMERKKPAGECWYLNYRGQGSDFDLMIIRNRVVRIERTYVPT